MPLPELVYAKGGQNPKPPKQVRLPDGSTCEIEEFWWELQASIARWLWAEELLAAGNIPVKYGDIAHSEYGWQATFGKAIPGRTPNCRYATDTQYVDCG